MTQKKIIQLDVTTPTQDWCEMVLNSTSNDIIVTGDNHHDLVWFISNFTQFLCRQGGNEVSVVYGELVKNLKNFIYQVNLSIPTSGRFKAGFHPLYDILLCFETEPLNRFIIWNNAEVLLKSNRELFKRIFGKLVVSAFVNRNACSTIKEDDTPYHVNQRNIFVFNKTNVEDINFLIEKEYYIPDLNKSYESKIDFDYIEIQTQIFID